MTRGQLRRSGGMTALSAMCVLTALALGLGCGEAVLASQQAAANPQQADPQQIAVLVRHLGNSSFRRASMPRGPW